MENNKNVAAIIALAEIGEMSESLEIINDKIENKKNSLKVIKKEVLDLEDKKYTIINEIIDAYFLYVQSGGISFLNVEDLENAMDKMVTEIIKYIKYHMQ